MSDDLHGAVPIELSYVKPDPETGRPQRIEETRWLYYNNDTVDKFQQESGLEMFELGEEPLPEGFPARPLLAKNGVRTLGQLVRSPDERLLEIKDLSPPLLQKIREEQEQLTTFEERMKKILEKNGITQLRFTSILLWSALLWSNPNLTVDEVGSMVQAHDLPRVYKKTQQAFINYTQGTKGVRENGAEGNAKNAGALPGSA